MKKILISLMIIFISGISFVGITYAEGGNESSGLIADPEADNPTSETSGIKVTVTEKIPGAGCGEKQANGTYECTIEPGFGTVTNMMGSMVKYATFLAGLIGVLFIVYNGIMYSMGGIDDSLKTKAKERITQTLIGLVVLLLSGVILNLVAPWIYTA